MNAVEIEEAVSTLAEQPFDAESFPFAFLEAFGNKETTIRRLKNGTTNQSDLPGGVLQRNNIHIRVCPRGEVPATLKALRESPATTKQKAKFILTTDGESFEGEKRCGWRNGCLRLRRVLRTLWLFPAAGRHNHGQTDP